MTEYPTRITELSPDKPALEELHRVLVIVWWRSEPARAGEVLFLAPGDGERSFGRGDAKGLPRVRHVRQRPGNNLATPPPHQPTISRRQLSFSLHGRQLCVRNEGKRSLLWNGRLVETAEPRPGDLLELQNEMLLLCCARPQVLDALPGVPLHPFGGPDTDGIVGESPAAWELRRILVLARAQPEPILVRGPSGAGKELIARAVHRGSPWSGGPLVSVNSAVICETLASSELFGNRRNYPNPGMEERPGLVGAAQGGTLFLDELGEPPHEVQVGLLRLIQYGEYMRLGESTVRRSDCRVVAATNRDPRELKHDLYARFPIDLELPGLDARREDIYLLARHLLLAKRAKSRLVNRFLDENGEPRLSADLVRKLLNHPYTNHVHELSQILSRALLTSGGDVLEPPPGDLVPPRPRPSRATRPPQPEPDAPADERLRLQGALDACNGNITMAAKRLGMSRDALHRRIRKEDLVVRKVGRGLTPGRV